MMGLAFFSGLQPLLTPAEAWGRLRRKLGN